MSDKLKVGKGSIPLEQKVVDAHLDRLGVTVDPSTRTVNEAGAAGSKVRGGLEGLKSAAAATGDKNTLEVEDLSAIREKTGLPSLNQAKKWLVGKSDPAIAQAKLAASAMSLDAAAQALEGFVAQTLSRGKFEVGDLANTFRKLEKAAADLSEALKDDALAHATPKQLTELRGGYTRLLDVLSERGMSFQLIVNKEYLPQIRSMADRHNELSPLGRIFSGLPVEAAREIDGHIVRFNQTQRTLLDQRDLFAPHPSMQPAVAGSTPAPAAPKTTLEARSQRFTDHLSDLAKGVAQGGRFLSGSCYDGRTHPYTFLFTSVFGAVTERTGLGKVSNSYGNAHVPNAGAAQALEKDGHPVELVTAALRELQSLYLATAAKAGDSLSGRSSDDLSALLPPDKREFAVAMRWYASHLSHFS